MHILIVRNSDNPEHATQRLHSTPLYDGLQALGVRATMAVLAGDPVNVEPPSHVVFHFDDRPAIVSSLELRKQLPVRLVCLCSDVYKLSNYRQLSEFTDLFLAPTELHRNLIQSAVSKPVAVLPEGVDPIALPADGLERQPYGRGSVCWFGYPESFSKSLKFLLPDALAMSGFDVKRFGIISARGVDLLPGAVHKTFSVAEFYRSTEEFGYALLSHFAHDLHINTFIKSPNKMITAIVRGLVPLVSATPAYTQLARQYGLEALCFSGVSSLARRLKALDSDRDAARFHLADVKRDLIKTCSPQAIARRFLDIVS